MVDHESLELILNKEAKRILNQIKIDFYDKMSDKKKALINSLIESEKIIIVDNGICPLGRNILAHGGRAKGDGKIHYYPDSREFESDEDMIEECSGILAHEVFHYFIQPDAIDIDDDYREMASYYTEGLVEKETRKFCMRHPDIKYTHANYGHYMKFVNMVQGSLDSGSYEIIFSESDYLKNIGKYKDLYEKIMEERDFVLNFLNELMDKAANKDEWKAIRNIKVMFLRYANVEDVKENLNRLQFINKSDLAKLENINEIEL